MISSDLFTQFRAKINKSTTRSPPLVPLQYSLGGIHSGAVMMFLLFVPFLFVATTVPTMTATARRRHARRTGSSDEPGIKKNLDPTTIILSYLLRFHHLDKLRHGVCVAEAAAIALVQFNLQLSIDWLP
uniref:Uncharacterized protein n=1 Tax=Pristionchus pacificus TaxID=54126 RepID=A0A2A6C7I4_PRIPA|eukprot:PDM74067.1 hypothetical protein PRIPAC_41423 [Pristionchus pacificus]